MPIDLLSISDKDTWAYGEALRKMASTLHFDFINFSRIKDLLDIPLPEKLTEIVYVANCTSFRRHLLNQYGQSDLNIDHEIARNPDTKATYLGYKRFLESDLMYIFPKGPQRGANEYKRDCKFLAKQMLIRGYVCRAALPQNLTRTLLYVADFDSSSEFADTVSHFQAFSRAVKKAFPDYLRLSIHESVAGSKLSMCLLNTRTGFTTPWHCSVAQLQDGEWVSAPRGELSKDDRLELVYVDGQPSYFKEKTPEDGRAPISEATASYLRSPKVISASKHLSKSSTPTEASSVMSVESDLTAPNPDSGHESINTSQASSPRLTVNKPDQMFETDVHSTAQLAQSTATDSSISYGRRLIPQIMDTLAVTQPERTVFSLTGSCDGEVKFEHVSARAFAATVDHLAWWLQDQIGQADTIRPIGYIGPRTLIAGYPHQPKEPLFAEIVLDDLRHVLLTYACAKTGNTVSSSPQIVHSKTGSDF